MTEGELPTKANGTKGVGKAIINALGFLSFLFGSLVLFAVVFGTIGSIFMSTKRLFQVNRVNKEEDRSRAEQEERSQ